VALEVVSHCPGLQGSSTELLRNNVGLGLIAWPIDGNKQGTYGLHVAFALRFPDDDIEAILAPRAEPRKVFSYQFRLTLTVVYST
jgi:hypothetical protein